MSMPMSMLTSMSMSMSIGYLDSMPIPSLLSMLMSILIPRYHKQLNKIEVLKLAAVAEWIK